MEQQSETSVAKSQDTTASDTFPVGMILLCIYIGYSIIMKLWGLQVPVMLLGPYMLGKIVVICYGLISTIILSICLYGVLKRKKWARATVLGWFGFWIIYILFDFFLTFANKAEVVGLYQHIMPQQSGLDEFTVMLSKLMGVVFILIINTIVCWYAYSKERFFTR